MATGTPRDQLQDAAQATTDSVGASLTSFAGALRTAAKEPGVQGQSAGRVAEWAADGLERVSSTLRGKDLNGMLHDVQSFARSQPVAFFFAAAAAGFLATRFLKAGAAPQPEPSFEPRPQDFPPPGAGAPERADISSTTPF